MRSHTRLTTFVRLVSAACLAAGFVLASPQPANAADLSPYTDGDGTRWLTGCVLNDLAAVLVDRGGFIAGGPLPILCIEGYALVAKRLN